MLDTKALLEEGKVCNNTLLKVNKFKSKQFFCNLGPQLSVIHQNLFMKVVTFLTMIFRTWSECQNKSADLLKTREWPTKILLDHGNMPACGGGPQ